MRRIWIAGTLLIATATLVAGVFTGSAAAATRLTLSEGGVALPPGYLFEVYGRDNIFIEANPPIRDIACREDPFEQNGFDLEVLTNSKGTDELAINGVSGELEGSLGCESGEGRVFLSLSAPGPMKLRANGTATVGHVSLTLLFERRGQFCHYAGKLTGSVDASTTRQPLGVGLEHVLRRDGKEENAAICPKEVTISVELPSTETAEGEGGPIEAQVG